MLGYYIDEIILNINTPFYANEKLFELFCIKNDFLKYFVKCRNLLYLFKHFVSNIAIIPRNDLKILLLHNITKYFSGARVYEIVNVSICSLFQGEMDDIGYLR